MWSNLLCGALANCPISVCGATHDKITMYAVLTLSFERQREEEDFFMASARMHRGIAYSSGWTLPTESCPKHKSEL